MVVEASLPAIGTVLIAAIIDSLNPCAMGVLILLMSITIMQKKKMMRVVTLYIFGIFITYVLAGLGMIKFLQSVPLFIAEYISIIAAGIVVVAGLVEVKDFFWYGIGISLAIPEDKVMKIKQYAKNLSTSSLIFLGVFVAGVELPCTGGTYLAITLLLSQNFTFTSFLLLVIYNIIFISPLILMVTMVYFGTTLHLIKSWKHENRKYMRLAMGILLIFLGWLLMLIANGSINLA